MLVRVTDMRGVDLRLFDFDYDLTWAAFFTNAKGKVYGRYGGRDEGPADKGLSLPGLKYAMQSALAAYRRDPGADPAPVPKEFAVIEKYPPARRAKNCIHCHQVHDYRREYRVSQNQWTRQDVWVYPPPKNVGLQLQVDQGDQVRQVVEGSPAHRAGIREGDVIESIHQLPTASYGDVQYALHRSPARGSVEVVWRRGDRSHRGQLELADGWRRSDISWRGSMWTLEPQAFVYGKDLTAREKRALGLDARRLAFRQGKFVPAESRRAGIRGGDIIIGVDGKPLEMTMLEFNAWVRLNHEVGDRITYNLIRNGKRMEVPLTLTSRIERGR